MKVVKTNTTSKYMSPRIKGGGGKGRMLYEDGDSRCMWSHFYIEAAFTWIERKTHFFSNDPENYDFTYKYCFYYILSGSGTMQCKGGEKVTLEPGKMYITNRLIVRTVAPNDADSYSLICFTACGRLMDNIFAMLGITDGILTLEREDLEETTDEILQLCLDIREHAAPMQTNLEKVASILFGLVLAASEDKRRNTYAPSDEECDADHLLRIKRWIDAFFAKDIRINDLAEEFNYSPAHLSKMFKKRYGIPLMKYVMQKRIAYAKTVLETTEVPIANIAASMHFSNAQHFINTFKAQVGVTPAKYREAHSRFLPPTPPSEPLF